MRRIIQITSSSLKAALNELWQNKLRTFLSLFGITIGIFCIISVLATVGSLQKNLQAQLNTLGTNTIYIDKWAYSAGPDYPYWKFASRPLPKISEVASLKQKTVSAAYAAFVIRTSGTAMAGAYQVSGALLYGTTEDFNHIQTVEVMSGRYLSDGEFATAVNSTVMGYNLAEKLFGSAATAVGRQVTVKNRKLTIAGVIKKQGSQLFGEGGWQFDNCLIMPYRFAKTFIDEQRSDPLLMVQGRTGISNKILKDELKGVMRAVHKLSPMQDDDFALNDINDLSDNLNKAFVSVNIGGWVIGALAFIVGIFGVANIMFVTVKERTTQIGLKKALGAKSGTILVEFLIESAALCIIGGLIGLLLVFLLTIVATAYFNFPIFLSAGTIATAIFICIVAGILAGIVPASQAARLNPVVAIRS